MINELPISPMAAVAPPDVASIDTWALLLVQVPDAGVAVKVVDVPAHKPNVTLIALGTTLTVMTVETLQIEAIVYATVAVPVVTPVTTPVDVPRLILLLAVLHTPPVTASDNVVLRP